MNRVIIIICVLMSFLLMSCNKTDAHKAKLDVKCENLEPESVEIKNYAKYLFSVDTSNFVEGLKDLQKEFPVFLEGDLDEPGASEFLMAFATDTFCMRLNDMVQEKYRDTKLLSKEIKSVLQHFHYYYPEIQLPITVYLYVSGLDYAMPAIMFQDECILLSTDFYLGNDENIYDYIGMPRFRSLRCQPYYISRDLAESVYYTFINKDNAQKDVLTEMINAGKRLYFVESLNPQIADSVLMGYSSKQMLWVENYEADVWTSIIGNNFLYSTSMDAFRSFFGDAPFTNAFSKDSPARLGEYIGLQIIRSYMTNNDVSLQEMINNNDIQQIFQASQYKPKG